MMTKRSEQKEQRRVMILKCALDLFVRKGYGETRIADIAKAADMSMGLLFHYYESKERLYEELIRIGYEKMKTSAEFNGGSPLEFFKTAADDVFSMLASDPSAAKMFVLLEQASHLDSLPPELDEMRFEGSNLIKNCAPIIESGQAMGEIKPGNPEALSTAFWCSIQGIAQHIALYPNTPCPDAGWIVSILKNENKEHDEN